MEIANNSKRNFADEELMPLRDALLGLTAIHQDLVLLNYGHVIIRRGYRDYNKVLLLSGGIAGPDLCHANLVGKGMLTAAIMGDETAPSSRQILRTVEELTAGDNCGVVVIAQANAELFNFALAAERANADCRRRVKLLSVDDDRSDFRERNSSGFVLLTKILGALAENGGGFNDIKECHGSIANQIVTVPLNYHEEQAASGRRKSVRLDSCFEVVYRHVIDNSSQSKLGLHPSLPTVALINTSKTLTRLEELCFVKQVVERLRELGVCIVRLYLGNFVFAPAGKASLTIMKVSDNKIIEYLDAPCEAPGWQQMRQFQPEATVLNEIPGCLKKHGYQQIKMKGPKLSNPQSVILMKSVQFACDALISCERQLNIIDEERSRGNVGTRLRVMADSVNLRLKENKLPLTCPYAFLKKMSILTEGGVGGTMGSIYGTLLESAANVFRDLPESEPVVPTAWVQALTAATKTIVRYCAPELQMHTMYSPIKACEETVNKEMAKNLHFIEYFGAGVASAEESAQGTIMESQKHPDAGAHAVGIWMRALFEGVRLFHQNSDSNEKTS